MLRAIKREELPTRMKVHDSNWNSGIIIGNTIIFKGRNRKETKQIKRICKEDGVNHGFYVEYKDEPVVLYIIYLRD